MRPYWNGQIRVSLVSFGIELYSAVESSAKLSMHKIHEPTGKRVHYENVVEGTGPISKDDIAKGFEYETGKYLLITPDELESIQLESKKTIDIVQFVGLHEIPDLYIDKPYYVQPEKGETAEEAYRIIQQALCRQKKVGLGQMYKGGREYLVTLKPCYNGLLLETLRYEDEVREAKKFYDVLRNIQVDEDKLDLAEMLIEKKTKPFDPARFTDHYRESLRELIEAKLEERVPQVAHEVAESRTVVNLMEALRRSVEQSGAKKGKEAEKPAPKAEDKAAHAKGSKKAASAKASSTKAPTRKTAPAKAQGRKSKVA